jgi:hypothetical protein
VSAEADWKLNGVERSGLAGAIDGLVKIAETSERKEALGNVVLDPSGGSESCVGIAL